MLSKGNLNTPSLFAVSRPNQEILDAGRDRAGWIKVPCPRCGRLLGYWSRTGNPKPEHKSAKCGDVLGFRGCKDRERLN